MKEWEYDQVHCPKDKSTEMIANQEALGWQLCNIDEMRQIYYFKRPKVEPA